MSRLSNYGASTEYEAVEACLNAKYNIVYY
jgi:hypothetical protein